MSPFAVEVFVFPTCFNLTVKINNRDVLLLFYQKTFTRTTTENISNKK